MNGKGEESATPTFMRAAKAELGREFVAVNIYIKEGRSQVDNLNFYFKEQEEIESKLNF